MLLNLQCGLRWLHSSEEPCYEDRSFHYSDYLKTSVCHHSSYSSQLSITKLFILWPTVTSIGKPDHSLVAPAAEKGTKPRSAIVNCASMLDSTVHEACPCLYSHHFVVEYIYMHIYNIYIHIYALFVRVL